MIKKIHSYLSFSPPIFAVEHAFLNGNLCIVGVEAKRSSDEFSIEQAFKTSAVEELSSFIKKDGAISLVLTDDQVLFKTVKTSGTATEALSIAYPNLDLDTFYYQILQTDTKAFVAVCRKSYLDKIITTYKDSGFQITALSLGNLSASLVVNYQERLAFRTLTAQIEHIDGALQNITLTEEEDETLYTFGDTQLTSQFVLPLALIFKKMGVAVAIVGNLDLRLAELQKEFAEKRFFKNVLVGGVGLLLGILLINFFIFSNNYSKWQYLQEQEQVYTTQKKQLESRVKKVKNKETIVNSVLNTGFSKSSWYTDQLIQLQPVTVILKNLSYQPIKKTPRKDKPIIIKNGVLTVSGSSTVKEDFTNWLQRLEQLDFVEKVMIVNYGTPKGTTATFEIQLELTTNDTEK